MQRQKTHNHSLACFLWFVVVVVVALDRGRRLRLDGWMDATPRPFFLLHTVAASRLGSYRTPPLLSVFSFLSLSLTIKRERRSVYPQGFGFVFHPLIPTGRQALLSVTPLGYSSLPPTPNPPLPHAEEIHRSRAAARRIASPAAASSPRLLPPFPFPLGAAASAASASCSVSGRAPRRR